MSAPAAPAAARRIEVRQLFQWLSYLQYPALLVAFGYAALPLFRGMDGLLDALNNALLYAGVGIGMSSLQDPTRTQNRISRRVWEDPRKGGWMLWLLTAEALLPIVLGLVGAALADTAALSQLSLGLVAFGMGMIGLLKTAIEMREHHRRDRHAGIAQTTVLEGAA
ncbi:MULTISPECIES: hypothetical protein [Stenotrophomonas]|jgi:hypothetical protein|uniref:Uncharacterized protein n=1 Tax=Stenotrophomonas acidaminiphila TaxID=128780 RepID=A0A0R0E3X5_9GAMM|nr:MULTISPECIES: hypothetical protein [Stenotrophomonas]ALJ27244.1 hypothetical protein AOT14_08080 [Stenotrophomonas acidaminiphila]KRG85153.1 hypothetical protein ABB33_09890 [Stenotrophomonas acidaminiphila]QOF99226.1 hypothetical protein H7691_03480 [Stenotrophomonas sp. CW117]